MTSPRQRQPRRPPLGAPAPAIDLPAHGGPAVAGDDRWRLDEQRGRPVILIFHRHID